MNLPYELSALALRDLERIWTYTAANWSANQANIYYKSIIDTIDLICQYPDSGKSMTEIKENHRSKLVKSHMIIYKKEKSTILIDRIVHQSMDIENQLKP